MCGRVVQAVGPLQIAILCMTLVEMCVHDAFSGEADE